MLVDFLEFLKKPILSTNYYKKPINKLFVFMIGFFFCIASVLFASILKKIFTGLGFEVNNFKRLSYNISTINFFVVVFFAPILEELSFRLVLRPKHNIYIPISFTLFLFLCLKFIFDNNLYINVLIALSFFVFIYFYKKKLLLFIKRKYSFVFYSLAICFSLLHLNSINEIYDYNLLLPIILLPYFLYALSFSYVRMKAGIIFAIILHISINGIAFFIKYLHWVISN